MQWKITELRRLAWKIPKFITQKGERQASENFHENSILRLVTVGGQSVGLVFEQIPILQYRHFRPKHLQIQLNRSIKKNAYTLINTDVL